MQQLSKHVLAARNMHITIELLLETVFSTRSMQRGCKEDDWGDPVESQHVKQRLGGWCEMAASLAVVS
jgi:hypothetical protein